MRLRRTIEHLRQQHWTAGLLDRFIAITKEKP
jgi:hypothetical protein